MINPQAICANGMTAENECPNPKCHHSLALHEFIAAPDSGYMALHCKVCFANGQESPCHKVGA